MSILWIILIVILVLALLGFFSRGRWYAPWTIQKSKGAARHWPGGLRRPIMVGWIPPPS
jgi:hypothetical protein